MRHVTPWLSVNTIDFDSSARESYGHGAAFRALPSPNLFPSSIRMWFLDDRHGSAIEFDYSATESTGTGRYADDMTIRFGQKTKRIHEITFERDLPRDVASLIRLVASALARYRRVHLGASTDKSVELHLDAIRKAVASTAKELFFLMDNQAATDEGS